MCQNFAILHFSHFEHFMMHNITYVQNSSLVVRIRLGRYLYTFHLNYESSLATDELEEVAGEMLSSMRNAMSKVRQYKMFNR